jgi:anthranilate synthase component I
MESLAATPAFSPGARPRPAPSAAGLVRASAMVTAGRRGLNVGGEARCCTGTPRANAVVSRSAVAARAAAEDRRRFFEAAARGTGKGNLVPVWECIVSDHLTPVLAYRCLVPEDDVDAPSFLFESVEQGPEGTTNVVRLPIYNHLLPYRVLSSVNNSVKLWLDYRAVTAWWEPTR